LSEIKSVISTPTHYRSLLRPVNGILALNCIIEPLYIENGSPVFL